ncbi:SEL1-like repeat protein [Motiliproteus sp. MSK22-1]|uniref:SEL1-like repeat protein n=1 Tax=Motiliproteus sp. MSK22-1 TaxID=1897630 RepID=UPI00097656C1|nr:SEL1-like repeat protein [Motiliproteus sp. MSK22-1]OMH37960.1 hypothetical protein BGP75_06640 [Motiliproteus sp. MSK22-1]
MKPRIYLILAIVGLGLAQPTFSSDSAVAHALYMQGDYTGAYKEYRTLAEVGYARYQSKIASMYFKGEGVEKDLSLAYAWFALAASQGDQYGQKRMLELAKQLSAEQLLQTDEIIKEYNNRYIAPFRPGGQLK